MGYFYHPKLKSGECSSIWWAKAISAFTRVEGPKGFETWGGRGGCRQVSTMTPSSSPPDQLRKSSLQAASLPRRSACLEDQRP